MHLYHKGPTKNFQHEKYQLTLYSTLICDPTGFNFIGDINPRRGCRLELQYLPHLLSVAFISGEVVSGGGGGGGGGQLEYRIRNWSTICVRYLKMD